MLLRKDDLSAPATWDSEATNSTVAPFSDKLMMQQTTSLIAMSMGNYGAALGASTRVDVAADYLPHGWLAQPPQAADRKKLALSK